jgi:hypothetical protein
MMVSQYLPTVAIPHIIKFVKLVQIGDIYQNYSFYSSAVYFLFMTSSCNVEYYSAEFDFMILEFGLWRKLLDNWRVRVSCAFISNRILNC